MSNSLVLPLSAQNQLGAVMTPPISAADLDALMLHLLRDRSVLAEARRLLKVENFDPINEPHYALLWDAVGELLEGYGNFTYESLLHAIHGRLARDPGCMHLDLQAQLLRPDMDGLLYWCMHIDQNELHSNYARDILRRFLRERIIIQPLQMMIRQGDGRTYSRDFMEFLSSAQQMHQQIEAVRELPMAAVLPQRGSLLPPPQEYHPTGLGFCDRYIKGQRKGDCNGMLGVFGSGKTTWGMQLAVSNARRYYQEYMERGGTFEVSVFLSFEEPEKKVLPRLWANACKIRRDKCESLTDWNLLTTAANMEEYERKLFGGINDPNVIQLGEADRWDEAFRWVNTTLVLFDMSGSEKFPYAGAGYVDEVVALLEQLTQTRNCRIGSVVVDYAGLMCKRYMQSNNIAEERLRYYLGGLGDQMRRRVAEQFDATVWLLHQFNAEQNKRAPTALLHHSDSAEARNFAENLATCGCLGVMDPVTGCILLNWSKVRYNRNGDIPMPTLQIDGQFCQMVDVSNRFIPDRATHRFIDPVTAHTIMGRTGPVSNGPPGRSQLDGMGDVSV